MSKAISLVILETFHGICTWHIRENALGHVNHFYQKSLQFCSNFEECIDLHENEGEFLNNGMLYLLSMIRALEVLDVMNIKLISQHYILRRWRIDARLGKFNKIINNMLPKKSTDEELFGMCHVFISIANYKIDKIVNIIDFGNAKGIKKEDSLHKCKKWPKSWVEN
ncbi:hypothetical protein CR513_51308, partial [Mucuna pruriens]